MTWLGKKTAILACTAILFATVASLAHAELTQRGDLFVSFSGGIVPTALPRHARAPIVARSSTNSMAAAGRLRNSTVRSVWLTLRRSMACWPAAYCAEKVGKAAVAIAWAIIPCGSSISKKP